MSKYTGPKYRLCRREGVNLFGNEKFNSKKKPYAPGMHGPKGSFAKPSEYAKQLREKQKLKRLYGLNERQLLNYYKVASKKKEITGNALLKMLEVRLDNVQVQVGDKFEVAERSKKSPLFAELSKQKFAPVKWIKTDYSKLNGEIMRKVENEDLDRIVRTSLVIEYYSK